MKRYAGIAAAFSSAFIFGFTPILARLSYDGGSNAFTLTFFRSLLALPVLYMLLRLGKVPMRITKTELRDVLLVSLFGAVGTTLLLYASYSYVPVGIATTLHFIYPVTVTLVGALLFRQKVGGAKLVALALVAAGVTLFLDGTGGAVRPAGILLALASALTYTVYMLGVEASSLRRMHYFKLTFYICAVSAVISGAVGLLSGQLTLALTPTAWLYTLLVSLFVSVGAITLFQQGIRLVGASTTAVLSTLEPITGVVLGILVLGERMSLLKLIGCVLVLAGVLIVTIMQAKNPAPAVPAPPPPVEG